MPTDNGLRLEWRDASELADNPARRLEYFRLKRQQPLFGLFVASGAKGNQIRQVISSQPIAIEKIGGLNMVGVQIEYFLWYLLADLASSAISVKGRIPLAFPVSSILSFTAMPGTKGGIIRPFYRSGSAFDGTI